LCFGGNPIKIKKEVTMEKRLMILIAVLVMAVTINAQTDPQSISDSKMSETNPNQNITGQGAPAESLRKSPAKQNNLKEPLAPQKLIKQSPAMGQVDLSLLNGTPAGMQMRGRIRVMRTVYN
jgi:hypothetical protein